MPPVVGLLLSLFMILVWVTPASAQVPPPQPELSCGTHPIIKDFLNRTSLEAWSGWIEKLSGQRPVTIAGQTTRITLRHSQTFSRKDSAFQFVLEQLQAWSTDPAQIKVQPFTIVTLPDNFESRNLILDLPGQTRPEEVVILSAHLDTLSTAAKDASPGADDNATGVATLLEAARLFRNYRFERTIRLIFFGGEEQIEKGSQAYLEGLDPRSIVGVLNLDMFGYDNDNDRCFELHVGTLPASERIGRCFVETLKTNQINLTYDYLTTDAVPYSDHASFWDANVGAVLVMENYFSHYQPGGCRGVDFNPNYHTPDDRIQFLNLPYGFDIAKAALATTVSLAGPLGKCFDGVRPVINAGIIENQLRLDWNSIPTATHFRINQFNSGCDREVSTQYSISGQSWIAPTGATPPSACYQVEAITNRCVSAPSTARTIRLPATHTNAFTPGLAGWRFKPYDIPVY